MDVYESLCQVWSQLWESLEPSQQEKLTVLLSVDDEEQIRSNVELLLSFGDCGLCQVLKMDGNQIVLIDDVSHETLWKRAIVEYVKTAESDWFGVYASGCFDLMEWIVFESVSYSELDTQQQHKSIKKSLTQVLVPSGSFMMGALEHDDKADYSEKPRHHVTLTQSISVCTYAVTQSLYESVMGCNPSRFKGATRPVENISWCDAVLFCNQLSLKEGLEPCYELPKPFSSAAEWANRITWNQSANGYRLPTEAEWEYCARGGEEHLYSGSDDMDEVAWYSKNSGNKTHPVGEKKANGYGLYDMTGNVWEWVWDSGFRKYGSSVTEPVYVDKSSPDCVLRGGGWYVNARRSRVSLRYRLDASYRNRYQGFRFLRTP